MNKYDTLTTEEKMYCLVKMFPSQDINEANTAIRKYVELKRYAIDKDPYYYDIYFKRWNIFIELTFECVPIYFYSLLDSITFDELVEYRKSRLSFLNDIGKTEYGKKKIRILRK